MKPLALALLVVVVMVSWAPLVEDARAQALSERQRTIRTMLESIPDEKAQFFHDRMGEANRENQHLYGRIVQLHQEVETALVAEPFDADLFLAKTAELYEAQTELKQNMNKALVSVAQHFTAEERKVLGEIYRTTIRNPSER